MGRNIFGKKWKRWINLSFVLAAFAALIISGPAQAAPLNLQLMDHPDIYSSYIHVTYDATSDDFTADGSMLTYTFDDDIQHDFTPNPGTFHIAAEINASGNASSGTLRLQNSSGSDILNGSLLAFGFPTSGETLEFLFQTTGGSFQSLYGNLAGVILGESGFNVNGDFISGFSNGSDGVADVKPVPLPGAFVLLSSGSGILLVLRKRFLGR